MLLGFAGSSLLNLWGILLLLVKCIYFLFGGLFGFFYLGLGFIVGLVYRIDRLDE
jgi:hypothetical protein